MSPTAPPSTLRPAEPAVRLEAVTKDFDGETALDNLDLEVPMGQVTVLLGPNGAGKTTAIRTITGALRPDCGEVTTLGLDVNEHGEQIRSRCGVVMAKPSLYDRLSGRANLEYAADLWAIDDRSMIDESATRFGIHAALDRNVGGYSTGMKTRLALARALLHGPELLLLDEPTSGLDPESSHAVLQLINEMATDGTTVVLCTHLLAEADGLADRIIVLDAGRALVAGSQRELVERHLAAPEILVAVDDPSRLIDNAATIHHVRRAERVIHDTVRLELNHLDHTPDVVGQLVEMGLRISRVAPCEPTLDELYFSIRRAGRKPSPAPAEELWAS